MKRLRTDSNPAMLTAIQFRLPVCVLKTYETIILPVVFV
jgi:hypothetical protein